MKKHKNPFYIPGDVVYVDDLLAAYKIQALLDHMPGVLFDMNYDKRYSGYFTLIMRKIT